MVNTKEWARFLTNSGSMLNFFFLREGWAISLKNCHIIAILVNVSFYFSKTPTFGFFLVIPKRYPQGITKPPPPKIGYSLTFRFFLVIPNRYPQGITSPPPKKLATHPLSVFSRDTQTISSGYHKQK
jgi:hypothetical protein